MALRSDWFPALAAFESAARHQNFAHAAEELHLTASAVSHHVRKLESRLGVALFTRHARGVALTAEGRRLADVAGAAIHDLDGAMQELRSRREDAHTVRLTTLHSFAYTWLVPRLGDFADAHPDIRLRVDTEIALTRFDNVGPDLGIRHGPGRWPRLSAIHLMDESLFPVAAPSMPGLDRVRTAADVASLPLVADLGHQGTKSTARASTSGSCSATAPTCCARRRSASARRWRASASSPRGWPAASCGACPATRCPGATPTTWSTRHTAGRARRCAG